MDIVCTGFSRYIDSMTKTRCDATWHYIITIDDFKKDKVCDVSCHLCEHQF